jgi:hypothetical protein
VKPLALKNILSVRDSNPGLYEDLLLMQQYINTMTAQLGGIAPPMAQGGINVTGTNGVIDVQITDRHPQAGEEYFLEYATVVSFADAHVISLGAVRNYRTTTLAGLTTYWRWYKSTKLGGVSNKITFGSPPTAVTPGNLSTTSSGPSLSPTSGSGQSQIPGYGYHAPNAGQLRIVSVE